MISKACCLPSPGLPVCFVSADIGSQGFTVSNIEIAKYRLDFSFIGMVSYLHIHITVVPWHVLGTPYGAFFQSLGALGVVFVPPIPGDWVPRRVFFFYLKKEKKNVSAVSSMIFRNSALQAACDTLVMLTEANVTFLERIRPRYFVRLSQFSPLQLEVNPIQSGGDVGGISTFDEDNIMFRRERQRARLQKRASGSWRADGGAHHVIVMISMLLSPSSPLLLQTGVNHLLRILSVAS